jgi:hypothetical protein
MKVGAGQLKLGDRIAITFDADNNYRCNPPVKATIIAERTGMYPFCIGWRERPPQRGHMAGWSIQYQLNEPDYILVPDIDQYTYGWWLNTQSEYSFQFEDPTQKCNACGISCPHEPPTNGIYTCLPCKTLISLDDI